MKRALRLTRALVDKLPARVDERGPVRDPPPDPDYYDRTTEAIISALHRPDELWVFAIGSLIWRPRFEVVARQPGLVKGWRRAFCIGPDRRMRGSPSAPGLMLSMDRGGECWGFALRMAPDTMAASLRGLLAEEPPVPPAWVEVETAQGALPAIAFVADPGWELYVPEPPEDALADILATAVGHVGSMADYVLNTVTLLEQAGVHDPHMWRMQELIADRLELLP